MQTHTLGSDRWEPCTTHEGRVLAGPLQTEGPPWQRGSCGMPGPMMHTEREPVKISQYFHHKQTHI